MPAASPRLYAALLFSLLLTQGCGNSSTSAQAAEDGNASEDVDRPPLVRAQPVGKQQVRRKIETTAYLEAEHVVVVFPRVVGRVKEVLVDESARVQKDQVLARLDDQEIRTTLTQMEIQVTDRGLREKLAKLEHEAAQSREVQAKFEVTKTQRDLKRFQELDADLVSPRELDDAQYALDKATASLRVAEFQTRKAALDVSAATAAIREAEAKLAEVQIQLKEHVIRAPLDGVISKRMIRGGEAITTANQLFEVVDTENLIAYLDRPQRELAQVQQAKTVLFTADAFPGEQFEAAVDMISPVVDRETGSFKIRVRVKKADVQRLRPGLFARAEILTEENRQAIMIPKTAVLADGDDSVVFFIRDPLDGFGKARRLRLEPGIEDDENVECRNTGTSGLKEGDLVIISGQQDLRDQSRVELSKN